MKLIELSYSNGEWELDKLEFGRVSLIVGKNATGKSRTLGVIDTLIKILSQKIPVFFPSEWNLSLEEETGSVFNYQFKSGVRNNEVFIISETLKRNDEILLKRVESNSTIKNEVSKKEESISPPENKLILHTNRDIKKYPFLEQISTWAEQAVGFQFGSISPKYHFNQQYSFSASPSEVEMTSIFLSLTNQGRQNVKEDFQKIGFSILEIEVRHGSPIDYFAIRENDVVRRIDESDISQGMFRCMYLLIFLESLVTKQRPSTLIIDDLCEGLDYDRATKLGDLVYKKCLNNEIQLIATSNDVFLMDVVDISFWNVLQRNGRSVTSLNYKKNEALFDSFKYTGLSNFDFFSSDYLAQNLRKGK